MEREAFKKKFDAADTTFYKTWVENVVSECGKANRALQNEDYNHALQLAAEEFAEMQIQIFLWYWPMAAATPPGWQLIC